MTEIIRSRARTITWVDYRCLRQNAHEYFSLSDIMGRFRMNHLNSTRIWRGSILAFADHLIWSMSESLHTSNLIISDSVHLVSTSHGQGVDQWTNHVMCTPFLPPIPNVLTPRQLLLFPIHIVIVSLLFLWSSGSIIACCSHFVQHHAYMHVKRRIQVIYRENDSSAPGPREQRPSDGDPTDYICVAVASLLVLQNFP